MALWITGNAQISKVPLNFESDSIVWSTLEYPLVDENVLVDIKTSYRNGDIQFRQSYFDDKQIKSLEYFTGELDILLQFDVHGNKLNSFCINNHSELSSKCYYFDHVMKLESTISDYHKLDGVIKEFYPSGKLKATKEIQNGLLNGKFLEFWENGALKQFSTFLDDKPLSYVEFNKSGIMIIQILYMPNDMKKHLYYNSDGALTEYKIYKGAQFIEGKKF